ncbi:hypothetical protein FHR55_000935 [Xanthomonas arboricola]
MWCAKTAVLDFWRSIRRVACAAAAPAAPIRPSGTFPRRRGKGGVCRQGKQALVQRRCSAGNPLPSPAGGRRWRAAPDEGRWCRASHTCGNIARVLPPSALRVPSPAGGGREAFTGGEGRRCRRGREALVQRRCSAGNPLPSPAGGRRWRAAPDEGRLVPCESYLQEYRQTAAPIRPSGTFPRMRGKGGVGRRGKGGVGATPLQRWQPVAFSRRREKVARSAG